MRYSFCLAGVIFCLASVAEAQAVRFKSSYLSQEERLMVMTVAGIINRDGPFLFLQDVFPPYSYPLTDQKWMQAYQQEGMVFTKLISHPDSLVLHYREQLEGAVCYDIDAKFSNFSGQSFLWQGEFAAMLGGLSNRIPMSSERASRLGLDVRDSIPYLSSDGRITDTLFPGKLGNTAHPWNSPLLTLDQRYETLLKYGLSEVLPFCNRECFFLREITDFAIQQRMFQIDLAGTESLRFTSLPDWKASIIESVLKYLREQNGNRFFHVYGWMHPEPLVQWIASFGASLHEVMMSNLSFHAAWKTDELVAPRASLLDPEEVMIENKHYVMIIGSEGDAGNWNIGFQSGAWLSPMRGEVPLAWGFNLHLMEKFPFIARYYSKTATANDGFVSVMTPLGYTYPDQWPDSIWADAKEKSIPLLAKYNSSVLYGYKHYNGAGVSDYRGVSISNYFDVEKLAHFNAEIGARLCFIFEPKLTTQTAYFKEDSSTVIFNHINDNTFYSSMSNLDTRANELVNQINKRSSPSFTILYQRFRQDEFASRNGASDADMNMAHLIYFQNKLLQHPQANGKIEFITPEKFSHLIYQYPLHASAGIQRLEELEIFPQPALDWLGLRLPKSVNGILSILIMDMTGRIVLHREVDVLTGDEIQLPLQNLKSGSYLLVIQHKQERLTRKLWIQ